MTRIFDRRSTLVFVIAVLALVVAMSSTAAYAAVARNSVISRSIKNGEVKTPDLAAGSVTSAKIQDGAVTGPDIAAGAVRSGQLGSGAVNSAKIADRTVDSIDLEYGAVGAENLGNIQAVYATSAPIIDADGTTNGGAVGSASVQAHCPAGAIPIGGGADWVNASSGSVLDKNLYLHSSYTTETGWYARGSVDMGAQGNVQLRVRAVCLTRWTPPQP